MEQLSSRDTGPSGRMATTCTVLHLYVWVNPQFRVEWAAISQM
ncbi:hypothetical protein PX699_27490 [Sphingobium sp. H39-3-25]|nr:hypothetical protein [Sphingobium arseniciresistens]